MLVRHPSVLQKVQAEVRDVLGGIGEIKRADIRKMKYLECVLKESRSRSRNLFVSKSNVSSADLDVTPLALRLYPPVPANLRFAKRATVLPRGGGLDGRSPILITRGMGITYIPYLMHRRTDLFGDDAGSFRPERWEEEKTKVEAIGWAFLPFNDGPRVCLGKDLALVEATYGIVRVIQTFPNIRLGLDHRKVNGSCSDERHALTFVLASADGCIVAVD